MWSIPAFVSILSVRSGIPQLDFSTPSRYMLEKTEPTSLKQLSGEWQKPQEAVAEKPKAPAGPPPGEEHGRSGFEARKRNAVRSIVFFDQTNRNSILRSAAA